MLKGATSSIAEVMPMKAFTAVIEMLKI